ncbi:MAG TPA: hypothetical protein VM431_09480 [Phycisphaerae bacterium]|nr:hypothetical protein [Phycisphaerae bacterium]
MNGSRCRGALSGWLLLAALASAPALTGCTTAQHVYFRPSGAYQSAGSDWLAKRTYNLPPGSKDVRVEVAARGRIDTNERGVVYDSLHVRLGVENGGESAFSLDPAAVRLLDDEGGVVAGAEAYAGRNRTGKITIAAGAHAAYELVFDLPATIRLENLGSLRVAWPYRYGDKDDTVTTKFIKVEEVNYYYPRPYPDPWYYDPWSSPWGHRHMGAGYYHGW